MKGKPRFFCEHCGAEVSRDAKSCSSCGKYFSSVRCPKCGFTGDENLFADGCPSCGYSAKTGNKKKGKAGQYPQKNGPLPFWVYIITIIALLAAAAVLTLVLIK